jgi:hypothetical protein
MRWWLGMLVLAAVGCASTGTPDARVKLHESRARSLEADGRYEAALDERERADDERARAQQRAADGLIPPALTPFK